MSRSVRLTSGLAILGYLLLPGCEKPGGAMCQDSFNRAQQTVNQIDSRSVDSVKGSLDAVNAAIKACESENKSGEVKELKAAQQKIGAHYDYLKSRPPKRVELTPEELETLHEKGDPDCPKGMAYKHRQSNQEVRCIGPLPANMPWGSAKKYFEGRDYKVRPGDTPNTLIAEYGAELYSFQYERPESKSPPRCLTVYPPPGMGWQEATARVTGARVDKIKEGEPVKAGKRVLDLGVVNEPNKVVVKLGTCS